jgi:hypothetical protein
LQFLKSGESPSKVAITVAKKNALGRANERPWVLELLRLKLAIASAKWNSESKFPGIEATHLVEPGCILILPHFYEKWGRPS